MEPSKASTDTNPSPHLSPTFAITALSNGHARWMPTEEQLAILDGLYRQGMRTPSAGQLQQIMRQLRQHGHIEENNVLCWFNRMYMRQQRWWKRQKQKSLFCFNRMVPLPLCDLARPPASCDQIPPPSLQPTTTSVTYSPTCYLPVLQATAGNVAHHQQPPSPILPRLTCTGEATPNAGSCNSHTSTFSTNDVTAGGNSTGRKTLQLFPLQPTFVLSEERSSRQASLTPSMSPSCSQESETSEGANGGEKPPFFDFFAVRSGKCRSFCGN